MSKNPRSTVFTRDMKRGYCGSRCMTGLIQRLLALPGNSGTTGISECNPHFRVLAVTTDIGFYASVLSAANSARWRTEWARTLNGAVEICRSKSTPIVVYDGNLPGVEWGYAIDRLTTVANRQRIFLAAASIDEDLWRKVRERHGYDVVQRSASAEELRRLFHFAWLSLVTPADAKAAS